MAGQFRRICSETWPNSKESIKCGVYEWRPIEQSEAGGFSIRFLSPEGEAAPRVFHIEPLLLHWLDGRNTRFLETACAEGYVLLSQLETQEHTVLYQVAQALFRNRNAGHIRVSRQFASAADFIGAHPGQCPSVLALGFPENENRRRRGSVKLHAVAQVLLRDALGSLGQFPSGIVGFSQVVKTYESLLTNEHGQTVARQEKTAAFPFQNLPLRSTLDLLFTDGIERAVDWDWNKAAARPLGIDFRAGE